MTLPEPFLTRMERLLGAEYPAFLASYDEPAARGLRLNLLRVPADAALPFPTEPVAWCPSGRRYSGDLRPGLHPWHDAGVYYIQEPSAMVVAEAAAPRSGDWVLDLCAAPGGKSSHLASLMGGQGLLVANEIHPQRAKILSRNIERMGIANALVTCESPARLAARFPAAFDRIIVDAPCSGEGMFRKDEAAIAEWSEGNVALCAARQDEILDEAVKMLAPGGRIVYSTCTFAPEEDEGTVSRFLARHPEFEVEPLPLWPGTDPGRADWYSPAAPGIEGSRRLFPHHLNGEGHFVVRLARRGEPDTPSLHSRPVLPAEKLPDLGDWRTFCREVLTAEPKGRLALFGGALCLLPDGVGDLRGLTVLRPGLVLGQLKKNRFEPDHALAMALSPAGVRQEVALTAEDPRTLAFLRGETLPVDRSLSGYALVTVDSFPLGWGKASRGTLKNHLPKGLRRLG